MTLGHASNRPNSMEYPMHTESNRRLLPPVRLTSIWFVLSGLWGRRVLTDFVSRLFLTIVGSPLPRNGVGSCGGRNEDSHQNLEVKPDSLGRYGI